VRLVNKGLIAQIYEH